LESEAVETKVCRIEQSRRVSIISLLYNTVSPVPIKQGRDRLSKEKLQT